MIRTFERSKIMTTTPNYHYDQEADVLYIAFLPGEKATTAVELNDNILLRFDFEQKRAIGLTLQDFSVLVQMTQFGPRSFPLTGLAELETEWQQIVADIITSPPVNHILKVSSYTASLSNTIPITLIENLPILAMA